VVRTVFKTVEAFARGLVGSIPTLSRHTIAPRLGLFRRDLDQALTRNHGSQTVAIQGNRPRSIGWARDSAFRRTRLGSALGLREGELVFERPDELGKSAAESGARDEAFATSDSPLDYSI